MPGGMPLDLSGILNSYNAIPKTGDDIGQMAATGFGNIPSVHGTDLSSFGSMPYQASDPNAFLKSGTSAPIVPGSNNGNVLSRIFGGNSPQGMSASDASQAMSTGGIGHSFNLWDRLSGAAQGFNSWEHASDPSSWGPLGQAVEGFMHPSQAHSDYQNQMQQLNDQTTNPVQRWAMNTTYDTLSNPLSFIPLGGAAEALGVNTAAKALGKAALKVPGAAPVANALAYAFKPVQGARDYFVNAIGKMNGSVQSGANAITNQLRDVFQGTTPEQRIALTHAMESTAPGTKLGDPALENLRLKVEPILEQATRDALNKGLINSTIDPAEFGVGRYIPHINVDKFDENSLPFSDISTRKTGIDAAKARGLQGTIKSIAEGGGPQFEQDMAKILGFHLGQMNKSSAVRDLINEAMQHAIPADAGVEANGWIPGMGRKAVEYSHNDKTALLPEPEVRFLKGLAPNQATGSQFWSKLYRSGVNSANGLMFMGSPLIHILNNLGTQTLTHDPGILPKIPQYLKEAFSGVSPGSKMDDALKAGALHLTSELQKGTSARDLANGLVNSIDNPGRSFGDVLKNIATYGNLTPNVEKAYRAAAFERGLEKGMAPEESANWVRSMYGGRVGPGTASTAEKVATGLMPFFNWTKTAIGSNVKNFGQHPMRYIAGYNGLNNYNEAITGHPMSQNHNPLSVALPWKDKNGNQEYYTPYAPPFDALKLAKDFVQNGGRGAADFAFTRTNPLAKFPLQYLTAEQNPFANVNNKFNVEQYPSLPGQYNEKGMTFGNKGPKLPAYLAQLLQDVSSPVGVVEEMQGQSPRDALLSQLLGGNVSAPNPASAIKEQKYQASQIKEQLKSWAKHQGAGG